MNLKNYKKIKIKDFIDRYSLTLWYSVKEYQGSLNAPSADCYTFTIDDDWIISHNWQGGYDWTNDIIDPLEYLYNFNDKKLYQLK